MHTVKAGILSSENVRPSLLRTLRFCFFQRLSLPLLLSSCTAMLPGKHLVLRIPLGIRQTLKNQGLQFWKVPDYHPGTLPLPSLLRMCRTFVPCLCLLAKSLNVSLYSG